MSAISDQGLTVLLIVLPLAAVTLALLAPRIAAAVTIVNAMLTSVVAFVLLRTTTDGPLRYAIGGWSAPLGIDLYADSMTGFLLVATSIIILSIAIYAPAYLARTGLRSSFWPLLLFLHAALNSVYLSADVFNLYIALELLSLSAVGLIAIADQPPALDAALRYLLASLVASLAYLLGVAFLYHAHGVLDLVALAAAGREHSTPAAALGLMVAGLLIKGALFPMHFWLPSAHSQAPSPVSALLSGLVVKAPFVVLLRLWFGPFVDAPQAAATLLGVLGAAAILWGSIQALRQERLKMLVAYSTVAQVGYLFLFFPLARSAGTLSAVTVFIVGHALAKAAMFLAAGNIITSVGHDRIPELDRVAERLPLSLAAFGIAGVCVIGLPPSGNFVAKWLLIEAAFSSGAWGWAVVIVAGSLFAAAYVFRVLGHAFTPKHGLGRDAAVPAWMSWVPFVVALLALSLGLFAAPLLETIDAASLAAGGTTGHAR